MCHCPAASRGPSVDFARGREPTLRLAVVAASVPRRQEPIGAQLGARRARAGRRLMGAPLQGRHAVVTGAGRGIGAAIAARLVAEGARVTLLSRTQSQLDQVAAALGSSARTACADITDWQAIQRAFE